MEENLPNDRLEEFIKESFKDHRVDPGDHIWNKINHSLGTEPVPTRWVSLRHWALGIAASVVLGTIFFLAWNNIYLNNKLKLVLAETARLEQQANTSIIADKELQTDAGETAKNPGKAVIQNQQSVSEEALLGAEEHQYNADGLTGTARQDDLEPVLSGTDPVESGVNRNEKLISPSTDGKVGERLNLSAPRQKNLVEKSPALTQGEESLSKSEASKKKKYRKDLKSSSKMALEVQSEQARIKNNAVAVISDDKKSNTASKENTITSGQMAYAGAESISVQREALTLPPLQVTFPKDIVSISSSPFVAAASAVTLFTPQTNDIPKGSILSLSGGAISEKGSLRQPPYSSHPGPQPENSYQAVRSWQTGIGISKFIAKNFTLESGLLLKQYQVHNNINQYFLFGERLQRPGRPSFEHDFGYKIHSPGGIANIEIASEQLDPRATINDTEKINFEINNQSEFQYLSFPLGISFRKSYGKWGLIAGAGLHANLLIKQEVETKIEVNSAQLKLKKEIEHPKFEKSNFIVLNGLINAGLQYQLASTISVYLAPSIYIPFSNRNRDRDAQYSTRSYGFQVGLNYSLGAL